MAQCKHPIFIKDVNAPIPCGRCANCLGRKRNDWSIRLMEEQKVHGDGYFVTLTYKEQNLTYGDEFPTLVKIDLVNFIKRLRKRCQQGVRYYAVGEYGEKNKRPHYHIILFHVKPLEGDVYEAIEKSWSVYNKEKNYYRSIGLIDVQVCNDAAINYVTKYIIQKHRKYENVQAPFSIMSKGLGANYLEQNEKYHKKSGEMSYTLDGGNKINLPRYYKDKIFNKLQRQVHGIECQDKALKDWQKRRDRYERLKNSRKRFENNEEERDRINENKVFKRMKDRGL